MGTLDNDDRPHPVRHEASDRRFGDHSEGWWRRVCMDEMNPGVAVYDVHGRLVFASEPFVYFVGGLPEEPVVLLDRFTLHSDDGRLVSSAALFERVLRGDQFIDGTAMLHRSAERSDDAVGQPSFVKLIPLRDPDDHNEIIGVQVSARPIVARQRALHEVTKQLAAAEAAAEAKAQFLAVMSHEIRTPLNGVIGMLQLLSGTTLDGEQQNFTDVALTSGESLLGIINEILDLSRLEAGAVELESIPFELTTIIDHLTQMLGPRAQDGVRVEYHIGPGVPQTLIGDPGRIRQVVTNLAGNAVKFTETGSVVVACSLVPWKSAPRNHVMVRIDVTDTGPGIPEDRLQSLFEPFTQLDASTTRRHGGTGLGLTITKNLVEAMGGEVQAKSRVDKGSTFTVYLPLGVPEAQVAPVRRRTLPAGTRVLVVDDIELGRRVAIEYLQRAGCRCVEASSGPEALRRLDAAAELGAPFDAVVTDVLMSPMGGRELAATLRAHPDYGGLPIVAMSSSAYSGDERKELEAVVDDVLMKPLGSDELIGSLAHAAAMRRLAEHGDVVLVVDDNATNRLVAKQMVKRLGYTAIEAEDGATALELIASRRFVAVLMDCQMPGIDGYEATRRIRANDATAGLPVIGLTGNALEEDRKRCLDAGMNDHLAKPVLLNDLGAALTQAMSSQWNTGAEPATTVPVGGV